MKCRLQRVFLGLWIATSFVWPGAADSPPGNFAAVETAGLQEPNQALSAQPAPSGLESPADTLTRVHLLNQIEATDPTAWLLRFGRVEMRTLPHPKP
ncbi:hypothetical protein MK280_16415 [Myxococcota bacterium]|nr:hypothetical protein [Myxococcota bacterium]